MTFWKRRNVVLCFVIFYRRFLLSNIVLLQGNPNPMLVCYGKVSRLSSLIIPYYIHYDFEIIGDDESLNDS